MGTTCTVCGGRGEFNLVIAEWSDPNAAPQRYTATNRSIELPCKRCNGRGGSYGYWNRALD
ncbi:MAG: hypothetical protein JRN51_03830 [Nitrososphaerota archaeon]|nr:hypothetical protein [Nitrososphaerota archaeon]